MKKAIITGLILFVGMQLFAQSQRDTNQILEPIEIDFISNYYKQDGNHSPVGGGIGTEQLDVITQSIQINIPMKKSLTFSANGAIELFSSASQNGGGSAATYNNEEEGEEDDDDEYYSGASQGAKTRSLIYLFGAGLTKSIDAKNIDIGGNAGFYKDGNVTSTSLGLSFSKSTKDNNNTFSVDFHHYRDIWNVTYPDPDSVINGTNHLADNIRNTFSLSLSYSRVLSKKLTAAVMADVVYQIGMLNTPFHRVYFSDNELPAVERLPTSRMKFPVGVRLNYHLTDVVILRTFYRFYYDNWGIIGNTASIEVPIKAAQWLRLYPFYRFHTQTAANNFSPYKTTTSAEQYYTADYDLSALQTHKFGLGVSIAPVNGLFRTKGNNRAPSMFKSLDVRGAYYTRSDGLNGFMITAGMNFSIGRK